MASVETLVPPSGSFESGLDFTVHDWSKKFECKTLCCSDFKEFWRKNVSVIYSPQPECDCLNVVYDEEKSQQVLFAPLEWFVCGTKDTEKMFELLKSKDPVPTLCGKVFKSGEPTYSCRDCGLDPTCVLCVDCFRNSQHKNHRYKMSTSGGGGYCDCGDEEAWKTDAFCGNHHKGKSLDSAVLNAIDKLPPDLVERLRLVMRVVLQYCHQMLTWEHALNLPNDLQFQDKDVDKNQLPDTYACVLFNDETHTYEQGFGFGHFSRYRKYQVIETLGKAIGCTKKAAVEYATTIDREGRSIVKCSTFASCNQVRHVIERITSRHASNTLKVLVMHTEVIAHQTFAMRLLSWLQKVLSISEGFRLVFSQVMMETQESDSSLLESVMLCDTQLWKTARNQWHQLFISGMLMDQECKKTFAKVFTKNYPVILKEFIADDHDHSISVSSLSVQIFTVPTLAHTLIQEESAISVLLRAFLSECERNKNEEGKLAFQRNQTNSFRRAQYILYDLKYLVTVQPVKWNDALRKNFLHGLQSFLNLLSWMQGMDSVTRQVGQHVEFEAEWETGINLQFRVAPISTLLLGWCASDSTLFVKAFRAALKVLQASSQPKAMCVCKEVANHSASCLEYDVSTSPVTIHLPLSRFVAGLFLLLEKFGLYYDIPQFQLENFEKPSAEQLMELPLRTLVMLAQFRAGMWRRNGYSLLNQVYFYHNVRLRDEMFDRDIMMLQIAASMIESNEYLIHLIYKYGLLTWASESYDGTPRKSEDDNTRQVLTVAEEFLGTVLTIVSERFTPGIGNVTEAERIKKEIIQLLCIEPMPHSQLFKMLPKDPNNETGMEEVVNEVASFKKPQGSGTGKYELKPEFFKCFNPFYYHYTREEQSRAEEVQLKRKKQACEEVCCPPPVPPEFTKRFSMIPNILQCDVMLHIMKLVLERTPDLHSSAFSEAQFEKVLHLIGVALHEEERTTTKNSGDNAFLGFTRRFSLSLLEECLKSPRVESQKDLLKWVISKFKHVESLQVNNSRCSSATSDVSETSSQKEEDPVKDRKMKAELAAARRERIMAQMSAMQKNFIKEHADMFKETVLEDTSSLSKSQMEICDKYLTEDPISVGSSQRGRTVNSKVYTCILCREDQEISSSGRALVLAAFVQKSSVLSKNRKRYLNDPDSYDPMLFPADLFCAPHCSTCGHVMHSDCWQKFFESVLRKEQRRPLRFGRHTSFEVDKNEFLCPLCERLSNGVIPLVPPLTTLIPERSISCTSKISVDDWVLCMKKVVENFPSEKTTDTPPDNADKIKQLASVYKPMSHREISELLSGGNCEQFLALFAPFKTEAKKEEDQMNASLMEMMKLFTQTTYTVGLSSDPNTTDVRVPLMSWWSCSYTIHAIEWLLREQDKPLFGELSSRNSLCMEAVIRFSGASLQVFEQDVVRTHCVRMLRYLLLGERYLSSPQCCLDLDAFSVLVLLVLSMPVLLESGDGASMLHPVGATLDGHLMHLMFMFHLVQLLLTYPFDEDDAMETDSVEIMLEDSEEVVASRFYKEVRTASGFDVNKPMPSGHLVVHCIKQGSIPFLRCCAIFFHVLTDTLAPESLKELGDQEFEHLCKYLGLSTTINGLLSSPSLTQLALSWVRHPRTLHLLLLPPQPSVNSSTQDSSSDDNPECLVRHPLSVNKLIALPSDYSELINSVSLFTCPNSDGDDSRNPSMCLVCGAILCSQSYCCQTDLNGSMVGACTNHAHFCGSGVGVFLRIRDCKILLLSDKNKGCFLAPPYVDQYGETDQGLYRGNPLHLCPERYQELHELWLTHNVPEQVSHTMEQATSLPNWQLL